MGNKKWKLNNITRRFKWFQGGVRLYFCYKKDANNA